MIFKSWLGLTFSIILTLLGIFCITNPLDTMSLLSYFIGIAMVLSGVGSLVYFAQKRFMLILIDGVFSCIFGGILLFGGDHISQNFVPFFIAMWLILKGCLWLIHAFKRKSLGLNQNPILILIGSIFLLLGLLFVIFPGILAILISFALGLILIICGAIGLFLWNSQRRFNT